MAPVEDREVLDLGGGTGINAAALYRSGARVTIADASPAMLKKAAGKNMQVRLVQALAEDLPLPDSSFDIVLISDAWHHFTDQAGAAAEVARVLRPTGRLYIIDFDPRQKITKTIAFVEGLLAEPATFTSPDELVVHAGTGGHHWHLPPPQTWTIHIQRNWDAGTGTLSQFRLLTSPACVGHGWDRGTGALSHHILPQGAGGPGARGQV
ncbi:MAG: methyltransferase domain-containing protein [Candidatus Syntrophopropionicum ammoniitolerans]